jgi:hypothetical protein
MYFTVTCMNMFFVFIKSKLTIDKLILLLKYYILKDSNLLINNLCNQLEKFFYFYCYVTKE